MKSGGPLRPFIIAFLIALVLYAVAYNGIEHLRTRKGPWQVDFAGSQTGAAALIINQPALGLSNVVIAFPSQPAAKTRSLFFYSQPQPVPFDVPYGQCLFMDTTFQPGTLVFNLFGHEIQLIPRFLAIDKKEYPWKSDSTMVVTNVGILEYPVGTNNVVK